MVAETGGGRLRGSIFVFSKHAKSRHLRQPRWCATPAQKSSLDRGVGGRGAARATIFPFLKRKLVRLTVAGCGGRHFHCRRARSLLVSMVISCRKQRMAEGVDTSHEQGKVRPKMSLAVFLAHLIKSQIAR